MNKNDAVGWVVLLAIIGLIGLIAVTVAASFDQPSTVTCSGYGTTVTCSRS